MLAFLSFMLERFVKSYRSSLVGLAIVAADLALTFLQNAPIPPWAHVIVGVLALALGATKDRPRPSPDSAAGALCLFVAAAALLSGFAGCAHVRAAAEATIDCARPEIAARALDLAKPAYDALAKGDDSWKTAIASFATQAGEGLAICAVRAVLAELQAKPSAVVHGAGALAFYAVPGPVALADAAAYVHAKAYLAAKGQ